MKKLLCLLLSVLMLLSFAACDSEDDDDRSSRRKKKESSSEAGETASSGYEQAVEDMVDMYACRATKEQIYRMFPEEAWDVMGIDKEDHLDEYVDSASSQREDFEDDYGEDFEVTYKLRNETAFSDEDLDEVKEYLADTFDIKESAVTAAYEMELSIFFESEEVFSEYLSVAKIGNNWYILNFLDY